MGGPDRRKKPEDSTGIGQPMNKSSAVVRMARTVNLASAR